jgi:hypothetical protein
VEALNQQGKSHWVVAREDKINVKGKGNLQTYFLNFKENHATSADDGRFGSLMEMSDGNNVKGQGVHSARPVEPKDITKSSAKIERLINWNVDLLSGILKEIVASRKSMKTVPDSDAVLSALESKGESQENVISEVKEIIQLPGYRKCRQVDPESIQLQSKAVEQLRKFIECVAALYHDNPFHNFEHASHVTMSVVSRKFETLDIQYISCLSWALISIHSLSSIIRSNFFLESLHLTQTRLLVAANKAFMITHTALPVIHLQDLLLLCQPLSMMPITLEFQMLS